MMKKTIAICFLLLNLGSLCGQVEHIGRFEANHEWNNQNYIVVPNDKNGVLLVKPMTADAGKTISVQYSFLDTDMKEIWAGLFEISKKLYLKGYHYTDGLTYLLFQNRSNNQYIKIMTIDPFKKKVEEFEPAHIVDLEIHEFEVIKEHAIIGGYIENRPAVFAYDLKNDIVRTLPNVYQNNSELLEVKINSDSVTFNVLASELDKKKDRIILVNTYDYAGNAIRGYKLETDVYKRQQVFNLTDANVTFRQKTRPNDFYGLAFKGNAGDTICAARGGRVIKVVQGKVTEGENIVFSKSKNVIEIRHSDGSVGQYNIFKSGSAMVKEGDDIFTGTPLALISGENYDLGTHFRLLIFYLSFEYNKTMKSKDWYMYKYITPEFVTESQAAGELSNRSIYRALLNDDLITQEMTKRERKKYLKSK